MLLSSVLWEKVDVNSCYLIAQVGIGICTATALVESFKNAIVGILDRSQKAREHQQIQMVMNALDYFKIKKDVAATKRSKREIDLIDTRITKLKNRIEQAKIIEPTPRWIFQIHTYLVAVSGVLLFFYLIVTPFILSEISVCDEKRNVCNLVNGWWLIGAALFTCSPILVPMCTWLVHFLRNICGIILFKIKKIWDDILHFVYIRIDRWFNDERTQK